MTRWHERCSRAGMLIERTNRRLRRGVTLIEVLIVVAILGLIAGGVAVAVFPAWVDATRTAVETDVLNLRQTAVQWRATHEGECPDTATLVRDGVVDEAARQVDAWKQPFKITCDGPRIVVSSAGPDRRFDTEDDIVVPKPRKP